VIPIEVELPPKARAQYREMERKMFAEISGHEIEALHRGGEVDQVPAARERRRVHRRGRRAGRAQVGRGARREAAGARVDRRGSGRHAGARGVPLQERPRAHPEVVPRAVDISTPVGRRHSARAAPIGAAHPASMGHGIDGLQDVTNICAFFGHWWNLEEYLQLIERIGPVRQKQSGTTGRCSSTQSSRRTPSTKT
jgi:hypothetical protein